MTVDAKFVQQFNRAASLARDQKHLESEREYAALVEAAAAPGAVASPKFIATTRMRRAFCLMDLARHAEARSELEAASKMSAHLDLDGRYELRFALGNTLGALGQIDAAFHGLVAAISIAEDMDDYSIRPARCWARILAIGVEHGAWQFVREKAAIALNTARLRGNMSELEALATSLLRRAAS